MFSSVQTSKGRKVYKHTHTNCIPSNLVLQPLDFPLDTTTLSCIFPEIFHYKEVEVTAL